MFDARVAMSSSLPTFRFQKNKRNKNTLFRNTGYIETGYNKLMITYYIMQQLVKTNRFINNGKFYKVEF